MAHTLSAPERELIDSICARYATWAPEEPGAPHMEHAISAGLSNQSFLLQGTQRYVLRIAAGAEPPGVNRHREKLFHESAASASLAPPIRLIDAKRGLLITDYLEPAMNNRGTAALAELLRGIHKLNIFESSSSLAHRLQLWDQLRKDDSAVSQLVESRGNVYEDLMHRVSELDETPSVPCHNDLLAANRRQGDGRLMAIDWEYADCGHPFFDLAVCGSELARSERLQLFRDYLDREPCQRELHDLHTTELVYALIAASWYELNHPDSHEGRQALSFLRQQLDEELS